MLTLAKLSNNNAAGFLAICAFGLPGRTYENGPSRAIQAKFLANRKC